MSRAVTRYPRMYEGRVAEIREREFRIQNERYWLTLPNKFTMPAIGQWVYADSSPEGRVFALRVRTPLRDRLIMQNEAVVSIKERIA